jgi:hypothetical protein
MPIFCSTRHAQHQLGASVIEFVLMLPFFFMLFFMVIDLAVFVYDRGALGFITQTMARQASLYWMDIDDGLVKIRASEIKDNIIDQYEDVLLINPGNNGLDCDLKVDSTEITGTLQLTDQDLIEIECTLDRGWLGLTGFISGLGDTMEITISSAASTPIQY